MQAPERLARHMSKIRRGRVVSQNRTQATMTDKEYREIFAELHSDAKSLESACRSLRKEFVEFLESSDAGAIAEVLGTHRNYVYGLKNNPQSVKIETIYRIMDTLKSQDSSGLRYMRQEAGQ